MDNIIKKKDKKIYHNLLKQKSYIELGQYGQLSKEQNTYFSTN